MNWKETIVLCLVVAFFWILAIDRRGGRIKVEQMIDTVVVRDTLRDTILIPHKVSIARIDTVWLPAAGPPAGIINNKRSVTGDYSAFVDSAVNLKRGEHGPIGSGPFRQYGLSGIDSVETARSLYAGMTRVSPSAVGDPALFFAAGVPAAVPIQRHEYRTADYHAVVEGFRVRMVSMTVYPETRHITRVETRTVTKKNRFAVGIQAGYGFNGQRLNPYFGVGVQYNVFSF